MDKKVCDLQQVAEEKLQLIISNGTVDTIVEKRVTETVKSIVDDMFSNYSEFSKNIKEVLKEKMQVNFDNINIGTYNSMKGESEGSSTRFIGSAGEEELEALRDSSQVQTRPV